MSGKNPLAIFYVYILFDECAIPRYVGKGKGNRIASTTRPSERSGNFKNSFLKRTKAAIGEIPFIKVRENLTEKEALEAEKAFIAAIGRRKTKDGPLTNLSEGGNGFKSEYAKEWSVERRRLAGLAISASYQKYTAEELSLRGKLRMANIPPEQKKENSRRGIATLFANSTAEQRSAAALKASLMVSKIFWINDGIKNRRIESDDPLPTGWLRGRINSNSDALKISCVRSRWINDGSKSARLKNGMPLPEGCIYGRTANSKSAFSIADH